MNKEKRLAHEEKMKKDARRQNFAYFVDNMGFLEIDKHEAAVLCGVHLRTVERWLAMSRTVPNSVVNFTDVCVMVRMQYPAAWRMVVEHFFGEDKD